MSDAVDDMVRVRLDARQIRVLAHPLRARLLGRLRVAGPATATRLAEALDTNTGATSYHLRQLADVGLVVEDDRAAHGRQRWWRSAHDVTSWWRSDFTGDADAMAASDWLHSFAVRQLAEHAESWNRAAAAESPRWREAAGFSDYLLTVNATQLSALLREMHEVVDRHRRAAAGAPADDARKVMVYLFGAPRPDPA